MTPARTASGGSGPVLGLDTTGSLGSVALLPAATGEDFREAGGAGAIVESFEPSNRHAANLLPAIRRVLERAGVEDSELALLAGSRGPGSFTGLRVGLATVQGFALGSALPAVGVSSLDAAALADALADDENPAPPRRLVVVDALRREVFAAIYETSPDAPPTLAEGPRRLTPAEAALWGQEQRVERITGPGAARYREALAAGSPVEIVVEPRPLTPAVAWLGLVAHRQGEADLSPLYLREPDIHQPPKP